MSWSLTLLAKMLATTYQLLSNWQVVANNVQFFKLTKKGTI